MSLPTLEDEWRTVRLQLIDHIIRSDTWADIKTGADALFKVKLMVEPMIKERGRELGALGSAQPAGSARLGPK